MSTSNSQAFANTIESLMHAIADEVVRERFAEILANIDWDREIRKQVNLNELICDKVDFQKLAEKEIDWQELINDRLVPKALVQFRANHELPLVKSVNEKAEISFSKKYGTFWKRLYWLFWGG